MRTHSLAFTTLAFFVFSAAYAGPNEELSFAIGMCSAQPDARLRLGCYDKIAAQLKAGLPVTAARPPARSAAVVPPAYTPPAYTPAPAYTPPVAAPAAVPSYTPPVAAPAPSYTPAPAYVPPAEKAATPPKKEESAWYDPTSWFGSDDEAAAVNTAGSTEFGAERIPAGRPMAGEAPKPEPLDHITANVVRVDYNGNGRFVVTLDNGQVWRQIDGDSSEAHFGKDKSYVVTISRGFMGSYNLVISGQTALFKVKRVK